MVAEIGVVLTVGRERSSNKKGSTVLTRGPGSILLPHLDGGDLGVCILHENSKTLT